MPRQYTRVHRLLKILTLIQSERGLNAEKLAELCQTSVRNVYRDLKMLEGAGIPYFFDEQTGGYCIRRDFFMPPVELTFEESLALVALADQARSEQIPFTAPAVKALDKIRGNLPAKVRQELSELDGRLKLDLARAGSSDGIADVYELVRQAIQKKRELECSYDSLTAKNEGRDNNGEVFRFRPYALYFGQRAWYAVGHHSGRDAVRKLKLNRFTQIRATSSPYAIPDDFSLDAELGNAWRMIRGRRSYNVELWFDASFAENIADVHWHRTQQIEYLEDGSILFQCTVDGLDEIVWWVLSMGPHCEVRKPKALADRVCELAMQVAERYQVKTG